jgi:hypothetical protein
MGMNWLLRTIVDLFNALTAWILRRKYGAAARRLGRQPHEEDGRRGFVILEIDGLAHDYLTQALVQGVMPYLARLIGRRKLWLARWRCGLPSTTPASQAGILYGINWDIPGFRWYDKRTQQAVVCKVPGDARMVQDRISAGRAGLLRGGSSYTNLFDGDARLALFTLAAVGRHRLFENVRGLGFLFLFGLSLIRTVKVVSLSLWAWLVYVVKRFVSMFAPGSARFTFWGPLTEILSNIVFREVATFSVMVDIYRGMPAIYASYTGYDEIAHHFGAASKEAFRALRGLDGQIRQIDRIRGLYVKREYDLYVLSDHGLTPCIPFQQAFGQTLQQFLAAQTGQEVPDLDEEQASEDLTGAQLYTLLDEIRGLEARPHLPLTAQLLRSARRRLEDRLEAGGWAAEWDMSRRRELVVQSSGPLSHIYLNVTEQPMDLSDVTVLYPQLIETLTAHEGIWLVVGREGEEVVIAGRSGTLWVGPDGERQAGDHPLAGYPDPEWAVRQVARLARFPHSGDVILLGAWDNEQVVSFENQAATHGGLGGAQDWPFLAFSSHDRLSPRGIDNAEELYSRLIRTYGNYE